MHSAPSGAASKQEPFARGRPRGGLRLTPAFRPRIKRRQPRRKRRKPMERRTFLTGTAAAALAAGIMPAAKGQPAGAPEKAKLLLGVGGKPLLYYLPLTIAERRGLFKEEGLEVEINDLAGGARSLQSLVGGSVDVVTGAYEHTIRMQAKGQDIRAVTPIFAPFKSAADLKGAKIGVTAPGSST